MLRTKKDYIPMKDLQKVTQAADNKRKKPKNKIYDQLKENVDW